MIFEIFFTRTIKSY